jgi:hypothetical protein
MNPVLGYNKLVYMHQPVSAITNYDQSCFIFFPFHYFEANLRLNTLEFIFSNYNIHHIAIAWQVLFLACFNFDLNVVVSLRLEPKGSIQGDQG